MSRWKILLNTNPGLVFHRWGYEAGHQVETRRQVSASCGRWGPGRITSGTGVGRGALQEGALDAELGFLISLWVRGQLWRQGPGISGEGGGRLCGLGARQVWWAFPPLPLSNSRSVKPGNWELGVTLPWTYRRTCAHERAGRRVSLVGEQSSPNFVSFKLVIMKIPESLKIL